MTQVASAPRVDEVERVAAGENPVLRNLEITECYADLSAAMRPRTGSAADWCTFATWASRQAGRTIRGEDLLEAFQRHLGRRAWVLAPLASLKRMLLQKGLFQPQTTLGRVVREIHTPFEAFERASTRVAQGNLKVFAEIGREFARFLATVPLEAGEDAPEFLAFAAGLRPGPPPEGQDLLKEAFGHYQRQRREADPSARASWILLANLKIGLHEQTRLQPQIAAAVDAPIATAEDLGARVLYLLIPGSRRWPRIFHGPAVTFVGWIARRIRRDRRPDRPHDGGRQRRIRGHIRVLGVRGTHRIPLWVEVRIEDKRRPPELPGKLHERLLDGHHRMFPRCLWGNAWRDPVLIPPVACLPNEACINDSESNDCACACRLYCGFQNTRSFPSYPPGIPSLGHFIWPSESTSTSRLGAVALKCTGPIGSVEYATVTRSPWP